MSQTMDALASASSDRDAQTQTQTELPPTEAIAPHEGQLYDLAYEQTLAQTRDTQSDVARDWALGIYPDNAQSSKDAGTIGTSDYTAHQHDNDHRTGRVYHGGNLEAVRTRTGRILRNTNCQHSTSGIFGGNCSGGALRAITRDRDVPDTVGDAVTSIDLTFLEDVLCEVAGARSHRRLDKGHRLEDIVDYQSDGSKQLFTFADGLQLFLGRDSTAHGAGDFGFAIPDDYVARFPVEAEALLTPQLVRHARSEGVDVDRQGEWFFVDADELIDDFDGTIQKPGLGAKPYGPSPMDNHVPRDWKAFVADDVFVERFNDHVKYIDGQVVPQTVEECLERFHTNDYHYETDIDADNLYEFAEYVAVRGSVRHRGNDHFQESFDDWRIAVAHDVDVYTSDDFGVRID